MPRRLLFYIPILCIFNTTAAQDSIVDQDVKVNQQFWLDYNFTSVFDDTKNLSTQVGHTVQYCTRLGQPEQ